MTFLFLNIGILLSTFILHIKYADVVYRIMCPNGLSDKSLKTVKEIALKVLDVPSKLTPQLQAVAPPNRREGVRVDRLAGRRRFATKLLFESISP